MKSPLAISIASLALCLASSAFVVWNGRANAQLRREVEAQQVLENQREAVETLSLVVLREEQAAEDAAPRIGSHGPDILRDMATSSLRNDQIKALLARHGYQVQSAPPSRSAP